MKIGLIDVDSHNFPNLALMKIAAFHKRNGDHVEWWNGLKHYDKVYQAKVFDETYTPDMEYAIMADEIIKGGTGYDLDGKLPDEIEHIYPDYSIYDIKDKAYGYITRGCPRGCKFCVVGEKEGLKSVRHAELSEFWKGQKQIILLDPNLLACKDAKQILDELIKSKAEIDFNQGLDIRFMTDDYAEKLNNIKVKMIHFAWDNYEMETFRRLKYFRHIFKHDSRKLRVYVLTNFNTSFEQDQERVYKLREIGYDPFVMIYDKPNAPQELKHFQRWCNNKFVFHACDWESYEYNNRG